MAKRIETPAPISDEEIEGLVKEMKATGVDLSQGPPPLRSISLEGRTLRELTEVFNTSLSPARYEIIYSLEPAITQMVGEEEISFSTIRMPKGQRPAFARIVAYVAKNGRAAGKLRLACNGSLTP